MSDQVTSASSSGQQAGGAPTTLVTKLAQHPTDKSETASWIIKLMNLGMESPGFLSAEVIPPCPPEQTEWMLLQRFRTNDQITQWRNSTERKKLIEHLSKATNTDAAHLIEDEITNGARGAVATAIVTQVKKGREREYREWEGKMQVRQASFPGYRGSYVQPPTSDAQEQWTTMLRFDTPEALEKWFNSSERQELLAEGDQIISSTDFKKLTGSFPGWFPDNPETGESPAVWKTAMLVVMGLFPIVMLEIKFLNPLLSALNPALANFIGNVISVALTTWGTIPASIKAFTWWLLPDDPSKRKQIDLKGTAIVCCVFAVEIALLWHLL